MKVYNTLTSKTSTEVFGPTFIEVVKYVIFVIENLQKTTYREVCST